MTGFHRNWRSVPTNFVHFIFSILLCLPYSTSAWFSGTWYSAMGSPYACLLRPSHDNPLVTLCRLQNEIIYYSHQYHRDLTNDGWYSSLGAAWLRHPQHVKTTNWLINSSTLALIQMEAGITMQIRTRNRHYLLTRSPCCQRWKGVTSLQPITSISGTACIIGRNYFCPQKRGWSLRRDTIV